MPGATGTTTITVTADNGAHVANSAFYLVVGGGDPPEPSPPQPGGGTTGLSTRRRLVPVGLRRVEVSSPLGPIAAGVLDMFAPLDRALRDPNALRLLLYNLGWEAEIEAALLSTEPYSTLAADVADLIEDGSTFVADLTDDDGDNDAAFEALIGIIGSLQSLVAGLGDLDDADPPPGITDPGFWAELALDLPEYLIVRYLERHQALLYGLLRLGGVIEDDADALAGADGRAPYVRRRIVWDNLAGLIGGPGGPPSGPLPLGRPASLRPRAPARRARAVRRDRRRALRAPDAAPHDRRGLLRRRPAARRRARDGAADPQHAAPAARSPSRGP